MRKIIAVLGCVLALVGCKDLDVTKLPIPSSLPISFPTTIPTSIPTAIPTSLMKPCPTQGSNVEWQVHFSPDGGTEEFIVDNIGHAQHSVHLQGYSFTSKRIAEALITDSRRKLEVEVLLDKSDLTAKGSMIKMLLEGGVPVWIDDKHAIAHNKVILIDMKRTFTGSFNFTVSAEHKNAENSILLVSPDIYKEYRHNYDSHKAHAYRLEHL